MPIINTIEAWFVDIPLRIGFAHSNKHHKTHQAVLLRIGLASGPERSFYGYGESIPRSYLTGETPETVLEWLRTHGSQWLGIDLSQDPRPALKAQFDRVQQIGGLAAFSGLDLAIHDLWSKIVDQDLVSLLGSSSKPEAPPHPLPGNPLSGPVGLGPKQLPMIVGFYVLGFKHVKIKVSTLDQWQTLMKQIPEPIRSGIRWILDANGAFEVDDGRAFLTQAAQSGIEAVEEPLKKGQTSYQDVAKLCSEFQGKIRIIVDEHFCTIDDAQRWQGTSVIRNLRLAKNGGFTGALAHLSLLEDQNPHIMLGALVGETPLLEAATRVMVGLTTPLYTESSFGSLILRDTPFKRLQQGWRSSLKDLTNPLPNVLFPLEQGCRGLGVTMEEEVVKKYQVKYLRLAA